MKSLTLDEIDIDVLEGLVAEAIQDIDDRLTTELAVEEALKMEREYLEGLKKRLKE